MRASRLTLIRIKTAILLAAGVLFWLSTVVERTNAFQTFPSPAWLWWCHVAAVFAALASGAAVYVALQSWRTFIVAIVSGTVFMIAIPTTTARYRNLHDIELYLKTALVYFGIRGSVWFIGTTFRLAVARRWFVGGRRSRTILQSVETIEGPPSFEGVRIREVATTMGGPTSPRFP